MKNLVNTDAEKLYSGTFDYLVSHIPLERLKLVDSVSEKDSERSIKKQTNDSETLGKIAWGKKSNLMRDPCVESKHIAEWLRRAFTSNKRG